MNLAAVADYFTGLQARIVAALEAIDGQPFHRDEWQRPGGGGIDRLPPAPLPREGGDGRSLRSHSNADAALERSGGGIDHLPPDPLPKEGGDGRSLRSHSNADAALERSGGGIDRLPPAPLPREGGDGRSPSSQSYADAALERSGGGITCVIEDGGLFERGGVNFSRVRGERLPPSASASRPELAGRGFEAMGVSLVLHPRNPYCPTAHMNVRFFTTGGDDPLWWFGGGMDLTPYYGFEEDARHFHRSCKAALDPYGAELHARYKAWCDRYFFLQHRNEPRGVGGIFFDDLNDAGEAGFERCFALVRSVGDSFLDAYLPIIERRRDIAYAERERDFQAYRRGRYVEFNLVYDRGTLFGLQSGGRSEAILMSLPPLVKWRYDWHPEPGSTEEKLYTDFLVARDWI